MKVSTQRDRLVLSGLLRFPVEFHWSLALLALWLITRGGVGRVVGVVVVILVHELGHAAVARWRGLRVRRVEVHGLGGTCVHSRPLREVDGVWVAWGGVMAQAALIALVVALPTSLFHSSLFGRQLLQALTLTNALILVLNLLPIGTLDGVKAWRAVPLMADALRRRQRRRQHAKAVSDLAGSLREHLDKRERGPFAKGRDKPTLH